MKMLNGLFNDYTGDIYINGEKKLLHTPNLAKEAGIGMVYQELSLARRISIYENLQMCIRDSNRPARGGSFPGSLQRHFRSGSFRSGQNL